MQLFDFAVVFFSNECRGGGSGGCGVVEGEGRLGERETRTVERQGISVSQCGSDGAGPAWQRLLGYFGTVMGRIGEEKCCTRTGDLTSGLSTRLGDTVPVEGGEGRERGLFRETPYSPLAIWL